MLFHFKSKYTRESGTAGMRCFRFFRRIAQAETTLPAAKPQTKKHLREARAFLYDPYGNRTHHYAVKGRRLNRLTNGPEKVVAAAGLEPATDRV